MRTPFLSLARALLAIAPVLWASAAGAVPSFARQTGQPCMSCHVGGFGPALTEFGTQFKLEGYTMKAGDGTTLPLSGMLMLGYTHTKDSQDPSSLEGRQITGKALKGNDNATLDQASLFLAGRLAEHLGAFVQVTYDGLAQHTSIDNVDVRATTKLALSGGQPLLLGVSIDNNPGVQDPFSSLPAWGYPWIGSNVAPGPSAGTVLDEAFGQKATGVTAYALLDNAWYAALGTYRMQSVDTQKFFGLAPGDRDPGALRAPLYARAAWRGTMASSSLDAGLVVFHTGYQPDRTLPDRSTYTDVGVDGTWAWHAPSGAQATVAGLLAHEAQNGTPGLTEYTLMASWNTQDQWGFTGQRFGVNAPGDLGSRGTRLQVDWTPTGRAPLAGPFDPSLRVGLQLTAYDKLDGQRGRAASGADSLFLFAWLSF